MKRILAIVLALIALPLAAHAQVSVSGVAQATATITAIDYGARLVTLQSSNGDVETIKAGPEVKRFNELKVGQTVTFRYHESVVYQVRKAGQSAPTPAPEPTMVRGTGALPSGTALEQKTATVTIKAIDSSVPSVTVLTEDGRTVSFKVRDKKVLEGLKVGDKVDIAYTQALAISVQ
jgi:Cu/Ag efflux protein CusF